jgi:hypothetical protein
MNCAVVDNYSICSGILYICALTKMLSVCVPSVRSFFHLSVMDEQTHLGGSPKSYTS